MYASFRYLDGPRTGEVRVPRDDFAVIGRHPTAQVPFDPASDLQVSVKHAAVFKQGGNFMVRDLGSTNGTFLNGKRVRGDLPLEPGSVLQLGTEGPRIEFGTVATLPTEARTPAAAAPARDLKAEIFGPRATRPTERFAAPPAERRRSGRWKWAAALVVTAAIVVGGVARYRESERLAALARRGESLQRRLDGLIAMLQQASATGPFDAERRQALAGLNQLRGRIQEAQLDTVAFERLGGQIATDSAAAREILAAAAFDPVRAAAPSAPGVVVVAAEFPGRPLRSGSGAAVRSRGDTVWVVTARQLVTDSLPPANLVVIYNGFRQSFRATVAGTDSSGRLALLVASIRGGASTVKDLGDEPAFGPAAALGFPFGLDSLGDWRATGTKASQGTVGVRSDAGGLNLARYGSSLGPGMVLVDSAGSVVGLITSADGAAVAGRAIRRLLPP